MEVRGRVCVEETVLVPPKLMSSSGDGVGMLRLLSSLHTVSKSSVYLCKHVLAILAAV